MSRVAPGNRDTLHLTREHSVARQQDGMQQDGIEKIRQSPFIPHTDNVRGFVYDVHSGQMNEVAA